MTCFMCNAVLYLGVLTTTQINDYDNIIIAFSGGKDSTACFLHLLDLGADLAKVELWHHDVDGREGSTLMDWAVTPDYCQKFAELYRVPIYYSWKMGGIEGEMLRENSFTQPTKYETPDGLKQGGGNRGKLKTVRKFPAQAGLNNGRWCSAYAKIMVGEMSLAGQERFKTQKTLFISGERREESDPDWFNKSEEERKGRAGYQEFEQHKIAKKSGRDIDHWRPVIDYTEQQIWELIERHEIQPHPAYMIGFGRVSCAACIFGSANQWATLANIDPTRVDSISKYEDDFGYTINTKKVKGEHVQVTVRELMLKGSPYQGSENKYWVDQAMSKEFTADMLTIDWKLPAGAYGESCGPKD